jgi:hypothetical protein
MLKSTWERGNETDFMHYLNQVCYATSDPLNDRIDFLLHQEDTDNAELTKLMSELDEAIEQLYGLNDQSRELVRSYCGNRPAESVRSDVKSNDEKRKKGYAHAMISTYVGYVFGRWDIRNALKVDNNVELQNPFNVLPACPPGMFQQKGVPATSKDVPSEYPIEIVWDGIAVNDLNNSNDLERNVNKIISVTWKDKSETTIRTLCGLLQVEDLRDYFSRSTQDGFWDSHIKKYTKSRRQAPIYWLLETPKSGYSIWLYYPRLTKDTYFKILSIFVEPRIRLESDRIQQLRNKRVATGLTGREAKQLEKAIEDQDAFVTELLEFRDRIRRVADLNLEPDLNDGVILNLAPLHELVPWAEPNKCWEELLAGEYQWSSISKQLKARGVIK